MKKLILLFAIFCFVINIGHSQLPEIEIFDASDAEKVADFNGFPTGQLVQGDSIYFLVKAWPPGIKKFFFRAKTDSSWQEVRFQRELWPSSLQDQFFSVKNRLIGIYYHVDWRWNGTEQIPTTRMSTFEFDYQNEQIVLLGNIEVTSPTNFPFCCPVIRKYNQNLYLTLEHPDRSNLNYFSEDCGKTWQFKKPETMPFDFYVAGGKTFAVSTTHFSVGDFDLNYIEGNSTALFQNLNNIKGISHFNDTTNVFYGFNEVYRTPDFGKNWTIDTVETIEHVDNAFQIGNYFYLTDENSGGLLKSEYPIHSYKSIYPDSLVHCCETENVKIDSRGNILLPDLIFSNSNGEKWKIFKEGLPKRGLLNMNNFDGVIYGDNGKWFSTNGEDWSRSTFIQNIPTNYFASENEIAIAVSVSGDQSKRTIYKTKNNQDWVICDTMESVQNHSLNIFLSDESLSYSPRSSELWKLNSDCLTEEEFPKWRNDDPYPFKRDRYVTKGDTLIIIKDYGILERTFDFGKTWSTLSIPSNGDFLFMVDDRIVWTDYRFGTIWTSENWGNTWDKIIETIPGLQYVTYNSKEIYLTANEVLNQEPHFLISSDFGKSWIGIKDEILDIEFTSDSSTLISKTDGIYKLDSKEFFDLVNNSDVSSVNTQIDFADVDIYPNPFNDEISIKTNDLSSSISSINIFNHLSQNVLKRGFEESTKDGVIHLQTHDLPEGMYFLNIQFEGNSSITKKIVKN